MFCLSDSIFIFLYFSIQCFFELFPLFLVCLFASQKGQDRCESDEYTCTDGSCKPLSWVCDGYADCTGGVDESERVCGKI